MEYRNLTRVFTFNKAIRHYNSLNGLTLSRPTVFIMLLLSYHGSLTVIQLGKLMNAFYRTVSPNKILECLRYGMNEGFIISSGLSGRYSLTLSGVNVLSGIEAVARSIRLDK